MKKYILILVLLFNVCKEEKRALNIIAENKGWLIKSKNICEFSVNQFWKKDGSFCCTVNIYDDCDKWKKGDKIDLEKYWDTVSGFVFQIDSLSFDKKL